MKTTYMYIVLSLAALVAAPARAETYAITGGTVITLGSAGKIEHGTVLIRDGKIVAVGADVAVPADAIRIDASGKMVTPGIFDPQSQFGVDEVSLVAETEDAGLNSTRLTAGFDPADAINPHSVLIPINRIEGVTRAVVAPNLPQQGGGVLNGRGAVISLGDGAGFLLKDPAALFVTLGEQGGKLAGGSRAGALLLLREDFQDAKDFAANRAAYDKAGRRPYALSRPDLEALQPFVNGQLPVVVGVNRASDIEAALRLASDFKLKLVVSGGSEAWRVADQLAKAQVPVIMNPLQDLPSAFESLNSTLENAARLQKAGVLIAFEVGDSHKSWNVKQMAGNAVAYGLPWIEGLKAISLNPAKIYAMDKTSGSLEAGKDADVVVWSGDPLEVTSFADAVFIRGQAVAMTSRQTELRDRYLPYVKPNPPALPPAYTHP
ncbi:MAG TPA: amidohydrolase family protein [Gammaproteobacteria bacterium]|nr:amidohydrolase family protein [Gammaproteobacteria bacterium]